MVDCPVSLFWFAYSSLWITDITHWSKGCDFVLSILPPLTESNKSKRLAMEDTNMK